LANRRRGLYTDEKKIVSRAAVQAALGWLGTAQLVADHDPADPLARQVSIIEADPMEIVALRKKLQPDAILEPAIRRSLHRLTVPIELEAAIPDAAANEPAGGSYEVTITAGGAALADTDVMVYFRDSGGLIRVTTFQTDAAGVIKVAVPNGFDVAFVEPIPYAGFWIMFSAAPPSGSTIDCPPIAKADAGGGGWWHEAMKVDLGDASRGAGIKVGVIDTGCGPHPNLEHVTLVGAFIDGSVLPPSEGLDAGEHGTHTSGIIGARPSKSGDYAGIAPGCELFHARVFKGEGRDDGPTQADIINAIDSLSRDHQCDLINMSLGGGPTSKAEKDAIRDAAERGTLCICSAGNKAGAIEFPAAYADCAAVSAIGKVGQAPPGTFSANNQSHDASKIVDDLFLASFSCFGPVLACAAPGVGIVSAVPDRTGFSGAYMEMDGTSMASPAVCGTLAVILSKDATYLALPRDFNRSQRAAQILAQHCKDFGLSPNFEGRGLPTVSITGL